MATPLTRCPAAVLIAVRVQLRNVDSATVAITARVGAQLPDMRALILGVVDEMPNVAPAGAAVPGPPNRPSLMANTNRIAVTVTPQAPGPCAANQVDWMSSMGWRVLATLRVRPSEVVTDEAPAYPRVLEELATATWHHVEQYENNRIEADHGRLQHRLRTMRGLRTDRTAQVVIAGLASMQNLWRGHYELGTDSDRRLRVAIA